MLDKEGKPADSPANYLYASLIKDGCYRRPKGYVDSQEEALRQERTRLKRLQQDKMDLEDEIYRIWEEALMPVRRQALEGEKQKIKG